MNVIHDQAQPVAIKDEQVEKSPKPILAARDFLDGKALDVTAEALKKLPTKIAGSLAATFRRSLTDEQQTQYKDLSSDTERRHWMSQFVGDHTIGKKRGYDSYAARDSAENKEQAEWLMESQLASAEHLNDVELAKTLCNSGELQSRLSKYKSFAAQGVYEYRFSKETYERTTGWKSEAKLENTSDLAAGEFQAVASAMQANIDDAGVAQKRKKISPTKAKEPETKESKELREAIGVRAISLRKLKAITEKVDKECIAGVSKLPQLKTKGYPNEMIEFYKQKICAVAESCEDAIKAFAEFASQPEGRCTMVAEVQGSSKDIDARTTLLDTAFTQLKKQHLNDLKKLLG